MGFKDFMFGYSPDFAAPPDPSGYQSDVSGRVRWTPQGYQYEGAALSAEDQATQDFYKSQAQRMQFDPSQRLAQTRAATDRALTGLKGYADTAQKTDALKGVGKGRIYEDMMKRVATSGATADTEQGLQSRVLGEQGFQTDFGKRAGLMQYADKFGQQQFANRIGQQQAAFGGAQAGTNMNLNEYQTHLRKEGAKASSGAFGTALGVVGGIVGGIYGGPAGAMAGYGLGSTGGNYISSRVRG